MVVVARERDPHSLIRVPWSVTALSWEKNDNAKGAKWVNMRRSIVEICNLGVHVCGNNWSIMCKFNSLNGVTEFNLRDNTNCNY